MGFMRLKKARRGVSLPDGTLAQLSWSKKGKPYLCLVVDTALAGKLKWQDGSKIAVEAGDGEHEGRVRLIADPTGWLLRPYGRAGSHLCLGFRAFWDASQARVLSSSAVIECKSAIDNGALIITLPTGWFAKAAAAPAAAALAPAAAQPASAAPSRPFDMNKLNTRAGAR